MCVCVCALPCWELCVSRPPDKHRACWQKPLAPEGQWMALSAASCHVQSSRLNATHQKHTHTHTHEPPTQGEKPNGLQTLSFRVPVSLIHPSGICVVVLTFICSLKAKYLPETLSAPISWAFICSRLQSSDRSHPVPNNSLYWSETWATTLPTCLWKSSTACRRIRPWRQFSK